MSKCLTPEELKDKSEEYSRALSDAGYKDFPSQIRYFVEKGQRTKDQLMHLAPYIADAYKKLNPSVDPKVIDDFNIAQYVKDINELQKRNNRVSEKPLLSMPISEGTSQWMNKTLDSVGVKDIGAKDMTTATKVHEAGKSWLNWAKTYAADIYQEGLALAKQDGAGIQDAIDKGAKGEQIYEDIAAKYISDTPDEPLENIPREMWTHKLFEAAKNHIEQTTKTKLPDGFQNESMDNLVGRISNAQANDGVPQDPSYINEIPNDTTLTGFEVNGTVPQNDLYKFIPHSENIPTQSILPAGFNIERSLRRGIGNAVRESIEKDNPNIRPLDAIKSYLNKQLRDIIKVASTGLGSENPMNKNFTLDLGKSQELLEGDKFNDDFKVMADQLTNDGKIDMWAADENGKALYSDGFRKMYRNMIEHYYQKAHLESIEGDVLLDEKTKVDKDYVKEKGGEEISTFRKAILDKIGNHPRLLAAYDWADKNLLYYSQHLNAWAKNISGQKDGLINKIAYSMTGADGSQGREATYSNSFDKAVAKLYQSDWLRKGSAALNPNAKISELETRLIQGVPLTTSERLDIYAQSQRGNSAAIWYGDGKSEEESKALHEMSEDGNPRLPEKKGMTFVLKRKIEGRDAKEVVISYQDYKEMKEEFAPHLDEIKDTWVKGSNHLLTLVNRVFKMENGRDLSPIETERTENQDGLPEGLQAEPKKEKGFYYPHTVSGEEHIIMDKLNRNRFINDIASHKTYTPSDNVKMSAGDFYETMQKYRDGNSKYAAWTIPMRNMDNYFRANEQTIKDLGLEHKVQWWVDYKKNVFNPPSEGVLGKTGQGMMNNFVLSRLGVNPFVSAEQLTAIPLAANTISPKYLFRAKNVLFSSMGKDISNYDMFTDWMNKDKKAVAIYDEMNERCPYALYRNTNGNSEIQRASQMSNSKSIDLLNSGLKKIFGSDKFAISKADLLKNIQTPDKAIGAMYWTASKMQVESEGLFEHGQDAPKYWERVGDLYTQAITESQHSSDDAHRSMLATQGDVISKSLSLFGSQKIAAFNGFHSRVIDYISDPSKENLTKMVTQGFNVFVTNAAMSATINTGRFMLLGGAASLAMHKPEEVYQESFIKDLANNLPGAAPIVDLIYSKYKMGAYGHDFSYPVFEIISDGGKAMADNIHAITDGSKKTQAVTDLIYFVSEAAGIPVQPALVGKKIVDSSK